MTSDKKKKKVEYTRDNSHPSKQVFLLPGRLHPSRGSQRSLCLGKKKKKKGKTINAADNYITITEWTIFPI